MTPFSNPLLLGFDSVERTLERLQKSGDGYPPYNIERIHAGAGDDRIQTDAGAAIRSSGSRWPSPVSDPATSI